MADDLRTKLSSGTQVGAPWVITILVHAITFKNFKTSTAGTTKFSKTSVSLHTMLLFSANCVRHLKANILDKNIQHRN